MSKNTTTKTCPDCDAKMVWEACMLIDDGECIDGRRATEAIVSLEIRELVPEEILWQCWMCAGHAGYFFCPACGNVVTLSDV